MERPPFPFLGGWGMGNQRGATKVSGSEALPRLRAFWQKPCSAFQASASRMLVCRSPSPLRGGLSAGHTLPAAFLFFFFLNKITTQIRLFFSFCQPRQNFQRVPPTPRGPPFPGPATSARTPPPTRDQLLYFLLGVLFRWHQLTTEQKCPLQGECGAAAWGGEES